MLKRDETATPIEDGGHVETKIGSIPSDWRLVSLDEITQDEAPIRYGVVQIGPDTPGGVPIVPIKFIEKINTARLHRASPNIEAKYAGSRVQPGDVLLSVKGTIGQVGVVPDRFAGNIAREIARLRPKDHCNAGFLALQLKADHTQRRMQVQTVGSTRLEFSIHAVRRFLIALPSSIAEQQRIAAILRTWGEAIEKLQALRTAAELRLDAMASRLIHDSQHESHHLRRYVREVSERNSELHVDRILSVTNLAGFVLAEERFAHRVASADISNYKVVRRGQYAYNPSRINVGSVARLNDWNEGALSPMYVVFEIDDGLDSDFFGYWIKTSEARQRIALATQGSVRDTVSFSDLGSIMIPVPPTERQREIARALNAAYRPLRLIDQQTDALQRQRRGLMQKLLTGEWRVRC